MTTRGVSVLLVSSTSRPRTRPSCVPEYDSEATSTSTPGCTSVPDAPRAPCGPSTSPGLGSVV